MSRILVVDDEATVVAGIQAMLELHDFVSEGASDCEEAETLIAAEFFPVILADLRMRSSDDGFRLLESVKRLSPRSRVATITGYADAETERLLKESGVQVILRKPLDDIELMAAVRELLAVVEAAEPAHAHDDGALYAATVERLRAIAIGKYGFSRDETDELIQETWLLFLEKRRMVQQPRAWLSGTIVNLCRQEIDRRVRSRRNEGEMPVIAVMHADDKVLSVRRALESLDERSRTLCMMLGIEQRSYQEVSDAAGIPLGSVGPLYMRAKTRLRNAMNG